MIKLRSYQKERVDMQQILPLDCLEEQRWFCLNNFICALVQVLESEPATEKRNKGFRWLIRTLESLYEIEDLIEEYERAA